MRNPHKYDCYALDEPLIIGGGYRDDAASVFAPGVVAKPGGSASAVGKAGSLDARRTEVGGSSPPSGGDAAEDGETKDDARRVPMPAPTFSASSTATAAARGVASGTARRGLTGGRGRGWEESTPKQLLSRLSTAPRFPGKNLRDPNEPSNGELNYVVSRGVDRGVGTVNRLGPTSRKSDC